MRIYDILSKKRHGLELTDEEIRFFVEGFNSKQIPDYCASALCMAICCNGMNDREAASLTNAMMHSGDMLDLSCFPYCVDKHSTGGVADLTSLVVAPAAAAVGLQVAQMSGRALGHTGGTVDKLESIPGFTLNLTTDDFVSQINDIGLAMVSQTDNLTPADKKLYALRDVTATVDSIPLIASSIMSKKLASGAKSIILDVKYGSGAFMKKAEDAETLARLMVRIGKSMDRNMAAVITSMDYPLGPKIGNAVEVLDSADILAGKNTGKAYELSVLLTAYLLRLAKKTPLEEAKEAVREAIRSGRAYQKFLEWITAQGGDANAVDRRALSLGQYKREIRAKADGYVLRANTETIGNASCILGTGRIRRRDIPDLTAGIELSVEQGDFVRRGDTIATLFTSRRGKLDAAAELFESAFSFTDSEDEAKAAILPFLYKEIE